MLYQRFKIQLTFVLSVLEVDFYFLICFLQTIVFLLLNREDHDNSLAFV